jgi:sec-independent protein translocase protein TatB
MFEIGWGELLIIGVVALIAIGPKELPGVLRTLGQWMSKLRRMASEFQSQFHEAMREAEMADLKKQVDDMTSQAQSYASFDPVGELDSTQQQIESAMADKPTEASPVAAEPSAAPAGATPAIAPSTDVAASSSAPNEPAIAGADAAKPDDKPA